jgi:hypothetical protein
MLLLPLVAFSSPMVNASGTLAAVAIASGRITP